MNWLQSLEQELEDARAAHLLRTAAAPPRPPDGIINLCHNNYLGLSEEPEIIAAAQQAAAEYGTGSGASRLITGTYPLLEELEAQLASFKGHSSVLVFPTGYHAGIGVPAALAQRGDVIFFDRLAHSCLVDGAHLCGAKLRVFPHNDTARLEDLLLRASSARHRWIVVDGVYSMDGDVAPLPELLAIARRTNSTVIMDDAHGTGVLGERGRGLCEHFGLNARGQEDVLITIATLSKGLGAQGGAVLGAPVLREYLVNRARTFIYTTGLAPPAAGAALAGLRLIEREPQRVAHLARRTRESIAFLRDAGFGPFETQTPIIPLLVGESERALELSRELRDRGVLVLAIRPPTVPKNTSRLRLTVNTLVSDAGLHRALETVAAVCRPPGGAS